MVSKLTAYPPVQRALLGPFRVKAPYQRIHQAARPVRVVGAEVADVHVQRHGFLLGPGVNAHMRFGQQHGGRDAARAVHGVGKGVEQLVDGLQAGGLHGLHAPVAQAGGVGEPGRIAAAFVKVGGQV
jgi:hypothetical protein